MEMECIGSEEFSEEVGAPMDVTEPGVVANDEENNINTSAVDMLQAHEYSNEDGSDLAPEMNVDENTILLPETGENGMNADDPAIAFVAEFLQEEEQVLDPMATNGAEVGSEPRSSRRTPSQVPKKRRDIMAIKYDEDENSPDKQPKRRGRKRGSKVINGQVIYPDDDQPLVTKNTPKAVKSTPKSHAKPKPVKSEDLLVNDNQCRVCTTTGELINLFKKEHTKTYAEKLMAICPTVNIQRKDFLPQFICEICVSSINAAFALKTQCEQTDAELRDRLEKSVEKSVKKVRQPVAITYAAPDSDPEDFPDPPMDVDFKLSDATPPSAEDSDSDFDKPLAKRRTRTRRRSRKTSTTPKVVVKTEKKSISPVKKAVSTSPAKRVVKSEPDLNTSKSSEQDLDGGFSTGSEENYSPPKKRKKGSLRGERKDNLTCRVCQETLTTKEALKEHKKEMHSHHNCELCGRKFRVLSSLKAHMEKHTKSGELKCEHCDKHFPNKTERRKHMVDMHKLPPGQYICEKCKRAFTSEVRLQKHNESRCPGFDTTSNKKNKAELESLAMGKDLFKCVAPLTTTYWSDSFSD